jgi:hypothetical protein
MKWSGCAKADRAPRHFSQTVPLRLYAHVKNRAHTDHVELESLATASRSKYLKLNVIARAWQQTPTLAIALEA